MLIDAIVQLIFTLPKDVSKCSKEKTKEALDLILNTKSKCTKANFFKMTRYTSVYKIQKEWRFSQEEQAIMILFDSPEV